VAQHLVGGQRPAELAALMPSCARASTSVRTRQKIQFE
jgi:hypothetical protein